jgi:ankyrin repeat protein
VQFTNCNLLLIAAFETGDLDVMEFLLKKGLSPQGREDLSGWNIFHVLVSVNNHKGMKCLMDKLPHEEVLTLLSQGSKLNLNTVR